VSPPRRSATPRYKEWGGSGRERGGTIEEKQEKREETRKRKENREKRKPFNRDVIDDSSRKTYKRRGLCAGTNSTARTREDVKKRGEGGKEQFPFLMNQ
jgi:hypothetical protein